MDLHDDADMATVVRETVAALREGARHVGKADRGITPGQVNELQTAICELQAAITKKAGTAD